MDHRRFENGGDDLVIVAAGGTVFAADVEDPLEQAFETPASAPKSGARRKEPLRVGSALLPALKAGGKECSLRQGAIP